MFKLDQNADISGTCLRAHIYVAPYRLIFLFGEPHEADGYKVSGRYTFTNERGEVFTLYDWKCTSLYDPDRIRPDAFWNSTIVRVFNIGSKTDTDASEFKAWLEGRLNGIT